MQARARENIEAEYDNDVNRCCDILRASLVLKTEEQVAKVTEFLLATARVVTWKNRFQVRSSSI